MPLLLLGDGGSGSGGSGGAGTSALLATAPPPLPLTTGAMQIAWLRYAADWNAGTYGVPGSGITSTRLDTVASVSQYNHPAVIPNVVITSWTYQTGAAWIAAATTSNTLGASAAAWTTASVYTITAQAGDAATFSTTAHEIVLNFTGYIGAGQGEQAGQSLRANQIRNGAIATITVDGTVLTQVDTYAGTPSLSVYLDGNSHSIQVSHSGAYNPAITPVTAPQPLVTGGAHNTVVAGLVLTPQQKGTYVAASWRVLATSGTQFSLYKTPPGGSETLVASALATGTAYNAANGNYVPGITLQLSGTLTTADSATFVTDEVMLALWRVDSGTGPGGTGGTYTTPVFDSGASDTQWFLAEWDESILPSSVLAGTGPTVTPDSSWTWATLTPASATLYAGGTDGPNQPEVQRGCVPLNTRPANQYCQLQLTFPSVSLVQPWIRDLKVFHWAPPRDPVLMTKLALATGAEVGANLTGFCGMLATFLAETLFGARQLAAAAAIGSAEDAFLYGYGADMQMPPYTGESPQAYQTRIATAFQSRQEGGSIPFITTQMNLLVEGAPAPATPVTVAPLTGQQYQITVPAPVRDPVSGLTHYPGLPGVLVPQAQAIILAFATHVLNPVGAVLQPNGTGSNVVFLGS